MFVSVFANARKLNPKHPRLPYLSRARSDYRWPVWVCVCVVVVVFSITYASRLMLPFCCARSHVHAHTHTCTHAHARTLHHEGRRCLWLREKMSQRRARACFRSEESIKPNKLAGKRACVKVCVLVCTPWLRMISLIKLLFH